MIHKMKLLERPFDDIKNGIKPVEFRLYDEKRRKVKIGDKIEFSKLPDLEEKLVVDVTNLYRSDSFYNLFISLGYSEDDAIDKSKRMTSIYSKEEEEKYGVLGIEIKRIDG